MRGLLILLWGLTTGWITYALTHQVPTRFLPLGGALVIVEVLTWAYHRRRDAAKVQGR